jgi:hypothetical protein
MWQWLKKYFSGKPPANNTLENSLRLADEGIYYHAWIETPEQAKLWPWSSVREFGLLFDEAIYPDPWFGNYMEADWFFTVEDSNGPQRLLFDVEYFSIDTLPDILIEKLAGFNENALLPGWQAYQKGLKNFDGAGLWLAWQKEGFRWPVP